MEISGRQPVSQLHHTILTKNPSQIRNEVKIGERCAVCLLKFQPKGLQKFIGNQKRRKVPLNTVLGLHTAARALSRETFPYHTEVQERPRAILHQETPVANRFTDLTEIAVCINCHRDCSRRFSGHATFNHENSDKFFAINFFENSDKFLKIAINLAINLWPAR